MIVLSFPFFGSMDLFSFPPVSEEACQKTTSPSGNGNEKIKKGSDYRREGFCARFLKIGSNEEYGGEQQSGYQSAYNAASLAGDDAAYESGNV